MRKKIFIMSVLLLLDIITVPRTIASNTLSSCKDVEFIFARGTRQSLEDKEYREFKQRITAELSTHSQTLTYRFYELGSKKQGGYQYPASNIQSNHLLATFFNAGEVYEFGASINQGINELKSYINTTSATCKNTKYVLSGYSQGAMVITKTLEHLDSSKIIYIANFGDPKNYLPEGNSVLGATPKACRGEDYSEYRIYAPNCKTYQGILTGQKPYQTEDYKGKIGIWCENKDPFCGAGVILTNLYGAHTSYVEKEHIKSAATIITNKLASVYPDKITKSDSATDRDLVIVLDRTASMQSTFTKYKEELYKLAKQTLDASGRVAVFTYGDLGEQQYTQKVLDFGCTYVDIVREVSKITIDGGGDTEESALSALKFGMQTVNWKKGATKSLVLITDAGYHAPDLDGTTIQDVINTSLSIDPVNIYILTDSFTAELYQELAEKTGGKAYYDEFNFVEDIYNRAELSFTQESYSAKPGEQLTFSLSINQHIEQYEWDLDCDGIFEYTTSSPIITTSYKSTIRGFIQARIKDNNNRISTASAELSINNIPSASISNIKTSSMDSDTVISFSYGKNTSGVAIVVDEVLLGFSQDSSIQIQNLQNGTITLIAISTAGDFGESYTININNPTTLDIVVPNTGQH